MSASVGFMDTIISEWQIRDIIGRYARGVDRQDEALIRRCFHPGAQTHYGDFDGTIETFVPWVLGYVEAYRCTMHFMGTSVIDWPDDGIGDLAIAETYAAVLHEKNGNSPGRSWVGGIRYVDCFERRPVAPGTEPEWRIAERTVIGDWLRIDPSENHRKFGPEMLTGRSGSDDPAFDIRSRLANSTWPGPRTPGT